MYNELNIYIYIYIYIYICIHPSYTTCVRCRSPYTVRRTVYGDLHCTPCISSGINPVYDVLCTCVTFTYCTL